MKDNKVRFIKEAAKSIRGIGSILGENVETVRHHHWLEITSGTWRFRFNLKDDRAVLFQLAEKPHPSRLRYSKPMGFEYWSDMIEYIFDLISGKSNDEIHRAIRMQFWTENHLG